MRGGMGDGERTHERAKRGESAAAVTESAAPAKTHGIRQCGVSLIAPAVLSCLVLSLPHMCCRQRSTPAAWQVPAFDSPIQRPFVTVSNREQHHGIPAHARPGANPSSVATSLLRNDCLLCHLVWQYRLFLLAGIPRFLRSVVANRFLNPGTNWSLLSLAELKDQMDVDDFIRLEDFADYRKDVSDMEWMTFLHLFQLHWHWIICYLIMSTCCRGTVRLLLFTIFSSAFVFTVLNFKSLLILLLNACLSVLVTNTRVKFLAYLMFFSLIGFSISPIGMFLKRLLFHDSESRILLFDVCFTWLNAKSLSLSVDTIESGKRISRSDLPLILSYLFYFPSLFSGPVHLFDSFKGDIRSDARIGVKSFLMACLQLLKILFYALLLEQLLHVIHSKAMQFYPHLTDQLDEWTFCGVGYSLTCLFYLKYLVLYGFSQSLAAFDSVNLPDGPACVSRVCESRMLWRTFDRGLYQWLTAYFYRPLLGPHASSTVWQLVASAVSFACVCLWHRLDLNVIVWCGINFVSVAVEKYCHSLRLPIRIKCLLFAPLFALMVISNIFFLSNFEVGLQFLRRVFTHVPVPFLPVMIVMYAGCRVSFSLSPSVINK